MKRAQCFYQSFLLRIWIEFQEEECRASLQDVISGECHYFSSLVALMDFLQALEKPAVYTRTKSPSLASALLTKK
jgi:hypothetical protein